MYDGLSEQDRANYTRYPGGIFGGIARNGHGLAGYGSVLFELSQGTLGDREFRIRQAFTALSAALDATADGSLYDVDPESVDELPERRDTFPVQTESDGSRPISGSGLPIDGVSAGSMWRVTTESH